MDIIEISQDPGIMEKAIEFFHQCWGNESNFKFYEDCILHSIQSDLLLPKFYLLLENGKIIGGYALLANDMLSRQDLMPWFACLFVQENSRNQGLATILLNHGVKEAKRLEFEILYLYTELTGFYEKSGWNYFDSGYDLSGKEMKIYCKQL
jgi:N-acetylglutamate synthase-like GNAT family acetyltransferase